jgi:hypothetical protein
MTDKVSLYKAGHWPTSVAAHGAEKCQQDGTSGSRLSIPRETLESCGILLHTNPIRKEPSNWFARRVPVNEGELAEAVAEVSGSEFVGPGMRPWRRKAAW